MIRFSAALVIAGLGLLLAGAITSEMPLVYAAIAVSVCAALVLVAGVIAGRNELFGRGATAAGGERTFDRGVTPGPGTLAIPGGAAGAGLQPLTGRRSAAAPAQAGSAGPNYTGVGWPPGTSPADELWARVDAELAAAGASARAPRLTKDSSSEEVWGRVEQELASPAQWNPRLVIPAAEETGPAERAPAGEAAGRPAWDETTTWDERSGWADGADQTGQLVIPRQAEASLGANRAQHLAPAEDAADADDQAEQAQVPTEQVRAVQDGDAADAEAAAGRSGPADAVIGPSRPPGPDQEAAGPDREVAGPEQEVTGPDQEAAAEAAPGGIEAASRTLLPDDAAEPATAALVTVDQGDDAPLAASPRTPAPEGSFAEPAAAAEPGAAAEPAAGAEPGAAAEPGAGTEPADGAEPAAAEPAAGTEQAAAAEPGAAAEPAADPGGASGQELLPAPAAADASVSSAPPAASPAAGCARVIVVSGVPRYHRPGCILIRFLGENDVESVTREAAEAAGCVPCRACQPDKLPSAAESGTVG